MRRLCSPRSRPAPVVALGAALAFALALPAACRRAPEGPTRDQAAEPYERTWNRGPVDITLRMDRTRLTVAQSIALSLEAEASEGYEVTLPGIDEVGGDFAVVDFGDDRPRLGDEGRTIIRRWMILEPYLSGSFVLPALRASFARTDGSDPHVADTDPVTIEVTSLLPEDYEELRIEDIYDTIAPPRRAPLWLLPVAGALVLGGAGVLLFRRLSGRGGVAAASEAAHLRAYRELDALQAEHLVESGQIKLFYQRITGILRHYIEDRFGLRAPELTTEEFLLEAQTTDAFPEEMKQMLQRFLEHCDLVKFAELEPARQDIDSTYSSCRRFIAATEPQQEDRRAI